MKKVSALALASLMLISASSAWSAIEAVKVEGNKTVVTDHILNVVQTKKGEEPDQSKINDDSRRIYEMGYFDTVDAKIDTAVNGDETVTFMVKENPVIQDITFKGNTIYKDNDLKKLMFSKPGMVFNHLFFQNDLQRLRDKFQSDGYVMTSVKDVSFENGHVVVQLGEARVGEIVIQGNKITKTDVIRRYFPIKTGDLFNATTLRMSIARVRSLGFLDDVTVGFEPTDNEDVVNLIVNVREKKSASLMFSLSYGSSTGWGGGIQYKEANLAGRGISAEAGYEKGNYTNYWVRVADNYMDRHHFGWKVGFYRNEDEKLAYRYRRYDRFYYDEKRTGAYIGFGRKFGHDEKYSWYLTADWHHSTINKKKYAKKNQELLGPYYDEIIQKYYLDKDALNSKVFTTTLEVTRDNTDKYAPYAKGDRESIGIEKAWPIFGSQWNYMKYWGEVAYYRPIEGLRDYITLGMTDERPALLALRLRAAGSHGNVPMSEQYMIGGPNTVRGYPSGYERGNKMLLGNIEFRVPIDDNVSLVAFYDIGRVWNEAEGDPAVMSQTEGKINRWLMSPGIGVRVNTPIGMIRLDVAQGKTVTGKSQVEYHFGFGEMF